MSSQEAAELLRINYRTFLETEWDGKDDNPYKLAFEKAMSTLEQEVMCTECIYYYAPVCTFYKFLPMTSRNGHCYHGIRGKYSGKVPTIKETTNGLNLDNGT